MQGRQGDVGHWKLDGKLTGDFKDDGCKEINIILTVYSGNGHGY